jgi:L-arabinokinase
LIAFYTSGHGFGHASRDIEVLNELGRLAPHVPVAVRTSAPKWLFDLTLTRPVDFHQRECDTGIVQVDSLSLDEAATIARASEFHERLEVLAGEEATWLRSVGARLVVGDIPPLAFAAARAAGLPAIALGNFTWDWIYQGYREWLTPQSDLIEKLGAAYALADLALRLPMHGGFGTLREIVDLPFIARCSRREPADTRAQLGLPRDRRLALLSFGGYGLQRVDLGAVANLADYTVVVTADVTANRRANEVPSDAGGYALPPNVRLVDEQALYGGGLRYEDLVAAVDVVLTKPGYGIIAECVANDTAIVYTSRGHFVEYDVLVHEMPRWLRCGFISNEDLLAGRWQQALDGVLAQSAPRETIGVDGAERAARFILDAM